MFDSNGFIYQFANYQNPNVFQKEIDALKQTGGDSIIMSYLWRNNTINGNELETQGISGNTSNYNNLQQAIQISKNNGIDVWVKPSILTRENNSDTVRWMELEPSNPALFFNNYKNALLEFAKISQNAGATTILIGNEMNSLTTNSNYTHYWIDIINTLRQQTTLKIGYNPGALSTPGASETDRLTFAQHLDFVGISGHPILGDWKNVPVTFENVVNGMHSNFFNDSVIQKLNDYIITFKKPIYLSEIAFASVDGIPFTRDFRSFGQYEGIDKNDQAVMFDGYLYSIFKNFTSEQIKGGFIYHLMLENHPRFNNDQQAYSPFGGNADDVISKYFMQNFNDIGLQKNTSDTSETVYGGSFNDTINANLGNDLIYAGHGNDVINAGNINSTNENIINIFAKTTGTQNGANFSVIINGQSVGSFTTDFKLNSYTVVFNGTINDFRISYNNDISGRNLALNHVYVNNEIIPFDGATFIFPNNSTLPYSIINTDRLSNDNTVFNNGAVRFDISNLKTIASSDNDTIYAGVGNDTIITGQGNDVVYGDTGIDTVILPQSSNSYTVVPIANRGFNLVSSTQTISLHEIENITFSNQTINFVDLFKNNINDVVMRFYNIATGTHFYTPNFFEADNVHKNLTNYKLEGVGFNTPKAGTPNTIDIFRFFNTHNGVHFYTSSVAERDSVIQNLKNMNYEGVGFLGFANDLGPQEEVYRFYNHHTGAHFYTGSEVERDSLIGQSNFRFEGIGFYTY